MRETEFWNNAESRQTYTSISMDVTFASMFKCQLRGMRRLVTGIIFNDPDATHGGFAGLRKISGRLVGT